MAFYFFYLGPKGGAWHNAPPLNTIGYWLHLSLIYRTTERQSIENHN